MPRSPHLVHNAPAGDALRQAGIHQEIEMKMKKLVVHCKRSAYDVYIGRPSVYGNPFVIGRDGSRAEVIEKYRAWLLAQPKLVVRAKVELRGKVLGCWCSPQACHGDVLAQIANS